jgi:hypothetical protein
LKQINTSDSQKQKWFPTTISEFLTQAYDVRRGLILTAPSGPEDCRIHPLSFCSQLWTSIYSICILVYAYLLPIGLGIPEAANYVIPLQIFLSSVIAVDMIMLLNTGLIVEQEEEMNWKFVMKYQLKNFNFVFSVISFLPYVFVVEAVTQPGSIRDAWRLICMLNAICVPRMFLDQRISLLQQKKIHVIQKYELNTTLVQFVLIVFGMISYWYVFI